MSRKDFNELTKTKQIVQIFINKTYFAKHSHHSSSFLQLLLNAQHICLHVVEIVLFILGDFINTNQAETGKITQLLHHIRFITLAIVHPDGNFSKAAGAYSIN